MEKEKYIAPELTVVSFKVEQGFQASGTTPQQTRFLDMFLLEQNDNYNDQAQENWHEYNHWGDFFSW